MRSSPVLLLLFVLTTIGFARADTKEEKSPGAQAAPEATQKGGNVSGDVDGDGIYDGFDEFEAPGDGTVLPDDSYDDLGEFDDDPGSVPEEGAPRATTPPSGSHSLPPQVGGTTPPASGSATGNAIPVQALQGQFCRALAPAGWTIIDQDMQGSTVSLASQDGRMKAAYGVMPVNGGAALGYYGEQMRTPAGVAQHVASLLAGEELQAAGLQDFMGAAVETLRGARDVGFVLFRPYPVAGDPYGGYALSMRIALATSQKEEGIAGAVAAAITCTTQFHAPAGGYAHVQPKSTAASTGTSAKCQAGSCDEGDLAGTYNVQLGTGYVHSDTGQNFIVDPATDYHQTGPDGPGYYVMVGNSLQKAEPGWSN
jgi:hypothetical protein